MKLIAIVTTFFGFVCILAAQIVPDLAIAPDIAVVGDLYNQRQVTVAPGGILEVRLSTNTLFDEEWELCCYGRDSLRPIGRPILIPDFPKYAKGGPGTVLFRFRAVGYGADTVAFELTRPFAGRRVVYQTFCCLVFVDHFGCPDTFNLCWWNNNGQVIVAQNDTLAIRLPVSVEFRWEAPSDLGGLLVPAGTPAIGKQADGAGQLQVFRFKAIREGKTFLRFRPGSKTANAQPFEIQLQVTRPRGE